MLQQDPESTQIRDLWSLEGFSMEVEKNEMQYFLEQIEMGPWHLYDFYCCNGNSK